MRESVFERITNETKITVKINLDEALERGASDSGGASDVGSSLSGVNSAGGVTSSGCGAHINTGIGFFDHMLDLFAFRAGITLSVECEGDLEVDGHHTVEDVGICLGKAVLKALGDKKGITRYGEASIPMDECLANCVLDISGRPFLVFNADFHTARAGDFEAELTEEFFRAVAFNSDMTLHINMLYGKNTHHMIEAIFKAFGCAFKMAININSGSEIIQSTKGVL